MTEVAARAVGGWWPARRACVYERVYADDSHGSLLLRVSPTASLLRRLEGACTPQWTSSTITHQLPHRYCQVSRPAFIAIARLGVPGFEGGED